jgi:hypothetical protein
VHLCRSVRRYGEPAVSLLKMRAADCSKSSTPKREEPGFSETWVFIYQTCRATVAMLFFVTSLKTSSRAKLFSTRISHFPLSPYTLGPYFPLIAPSHPFQQLCYLQCVKFFLRVRKNQGSNPFKRMR